MTTPSDDTFSLEGTGYALVIPPEAEKAKQEILASAGTVVAVASNEESATAQFQIRKLAGFRISVENARKKVKAPVLELGKKIDEAAATFIGTVLLEEKRLTGLVGEHAKEVERLRREAEAEERRKFQEAKAAADAAEAAKKAAEVVAAKQANQAAAATAAQAEKAKTAAFAERRDASAVVATTRLNEGVRFVDDFDVTNIAALYAARPDLVSLTAKTSEVKSVIKQLRDEGKALEIPGIRIFQRPSVSTR